VRSRRSLAERPTMVAPWQNGQFSQDDVLFTLIAFISSTLSAFFFDSGFRLGSARCLFGRVVCRFVFTIGLVSRFKRDAEDRQRFSQCDIGLQQYITRVGLARTMRRGRLHFVSHRPTICAPMSLDLGLEATFDHSD
jgi:hypothetical protein